MNLKATYKLKLFVAGMTPGSFHAIESVREVCDKYLPDEYELEVIDIFQQNQLVREKDIIAVPTLIREFPLPEKRIIGDMRNKKELVNVLEMQV